MTRRLLLLLVLPLCACGPAPVQPPPAPSPPPAALTLGAIDASGQFVAYTEGQDVNLVEGAQGGFHVWMSYRYAGPTGGAAKLSRGAHRLADDQIVLRTSAQVTVEPQSMPLPMFMCPSPVGLSVIDQPIEFELSLDGDDGPIASGKTTLVPHCPDDNRDFCLRICTG